LLEQVITEEMATIESEIGAERFRSGRFPEARTLFARLVTSPTLDEFLTTGAYEILEGD
jgi:malate synthase